MKTVTRYIEATDTTNYILPAITLNVPFKLKRAIHIGIDKKDGNVACLCGQHHRQEKDVWLSPSLDVAPLITCGGCLRVMKALTREHSAKPYMVIMQKIGQKIKDAKFHVKQHNVSNNNGYDKSDIEPVSRILEGSVYSRLLPNNILLASCIKAIKGLGDNFFINSTTTVVHASTIRDNDIAPICGEEANCHERWFDVDEKDYNKFPNITCPKCVAIQLKRRLGQEPKRDKSTAMRNAMIANKHIALLAFYKKNKSVFDYVENNTQSIIPDNWLKLVKDYNTEVANLRLLELGVLAIIK
jgi:hypothetical protein